MATTVKAVKRLDVRLYTQAEVRQIRSKRKGDETEMDAVRRVLGLPNRKAAKKKTMAQRAKRKAV